jgi:hypothetical protein
MIEKLLAHPLSEFQLNTIWVSCEGENPADLENIGPIKYYPRRGFPGFYYPYENSEGYLSPLVAVHFERPVREYPPKAEKVTNFNLNPF